jgi:hypothetical protein
VTATVFVPLGVDIRGDVDNLCLDEAGGRRRRRGSDGGCVSIYLGRSCCRVTGLLGRGGRGLVLRRRIVVFSGRLAAAHIEVHTCVGQASLGLFVVGKNVGHRVTRLSVGTRENGAPCVVCSRLCFANLVTSDEIVSIFSGRAVHASTVNIGDVEVVSLVARGFVDVVLQLRDVAAFALRRLGQFDGNANGGTCRIGIVLGIYIALLQCDHLVSRAAITLEDGPKVDVVVAAVDDTSEGLLQIAFLHKGYGTSRRRGGCDDGGSRGKECSELHCG